MYRLFKKFQIVIPFLLLVIIFRVPGLSFAQAETPTETPTPIQSGPTPTPTTTGQNKEDLQKQISELQGKISDLKSQQNSLSSQIKIIDSQNALTELKIANAQVEIKSLKEDIGITQEKIESSEGDLEKTSHAFIGRAEAVYKQGSIDPWHLVLTSNTLDNFFTRLKYLKIVQLFDKKQIYAAEQAKVSYQQQQDILEDKKKEEEALNQKLEDYTEQLNKDREAKKTLLTQTQGSESNYQKLLAQAQAQLAGFSRFVTSQGGASILSNQTVCDDWGCYYNQRDSQWGSNALNGTQYTLASDGCLVTSMAMVYTHIGRRNVTPQTINSNSSNFASYYPAFLNKTISADGLSTSRIYATIDSELNAGKPVIIGIGRGPDHFVVFISGSGGNYKMHDPFIPNGNNVNFADHYSTSNINSIERVSF